MDITICLYNFSNMEKIQYRRNMYYEQENAIYEKIKNETDPDLQIAWTHLLVSNKNRFQQYQDKLVALADQPDKKGVADYLKKLQKKS